MEAVALRRLAIRRGYICPSCIARRSVKSASRIRSFHTSPRRRQDVLAALEERGLINQIAGNREDLKSILSNRKVSIYAGIDPTASALHLGHLLPLMVLFWLRNHGHNVISLIGGATAKVGDPSGRLTSREKDQDKEQRRKLLGMSSATAKLWESAGLYGKRHGYEATGETQLLNNQKWLGHVGIMGFLTTVGSGVRMGTMLGRDTVRNKMQNGDGMSFAEFAYPLLQAWDWWHMYKTYGTQIQVGGADQYGNITAGMDVVKYASQDHGRGVLESAEGSTEPMGLTVPLLTTSSGEKFGKSAGNAIWLNHLMTPPFDLYGFFLKVSDADVERYLKLFTFLPVLTISELMIPHNLDPGKRIAQHKLASEVLELVHGAEVAEKTRARHARMRKPTLSSLKSTESAKPEPTPMPATASAPMCDVLVGDGVVGLTEDAIAALELNLDGEAEKSGDADEDPGLREQHTILAESRVLGLPFPTVLHTANLASSTSEAKRMIKAGGVYVAQRSAAGEEDDAGSDDLTFVPVQKLGEGAVVGRELLIEDQLVLRLGKWKIRVVEVVDDGLFDSDLFRI